MSNYYGINFPFQDSTKGDFLRMTETAQQEIRSNLIHLLLTRKGTRYFLPDFGTRLYDYIFEQMDGQTFSNIEEDIRESCKKYIPNIDITSISIKEADPNELTADKNTEGDLDNRIYRVGTKSTAPYTAQVRIDYSIKNSSVFNTHDFVIINL
jgi:phage baseplate assembly protein W